MKHTRIRLNPNGSWLPLTILFLVLAVAVAGVIATHVRYG
jgi:hypothetical protein